MRSSRVGTLCVLLVLAALLPPAPARSAGDATVILDTSGYWRNYFVLSPPVVRDGKEVKALPTVNAQTPAPPKDWISPDFDDSAWARTPGRPLPGGMPQAATTPPEFIDAGICVVEHGSPALAMLCMRGKFSVTDPATIKGLKLSLRYRGGVIVYLNGREAGRSHIADGAEGPDALAEDYPRQAFFRDDDTPCAGEDRKRPTIELAAWKARLRAAEIAIPADALRKGINVLALELHRTAYLPEVAKANIGGWYTPAEGWATCGLLAARLTADSSTGVTPNCSRPRGFQVWSSQILQPDFDLDYGDANEPLRAIRIVGSPGGGFAGKVVAGSDQPIQGLRGTLTGLTSDKGSIPASAVTIQYAVPTGSEPIMAARYPASADVMDGLLDSPPATVEVRAKKPIHASLIPPGQPEWVFGAVCPIWLTVAVPADAAPGQYKGVLTVSSDGQKPVVVPVELTVSSWRLPPPRAFHTFVDLIESPESVALQYGVPLYGEKHWKLLAKSIERLGYVGNWTAHIPLICQSNMGNEQSMVRWIRQADGTYKYDFTVFDRYLDLVERHMGKPRVINLVVWDKFIGATLDGHGMIQKSVGAAEAIPVSALEPDGSVVTITVGQYDEKSKAQWRALAGEVQARLKARGLEKAAALGTAMDCFPSGEVLAFWQDVWPEVSWTRYSHMETGTIPGTKKPWAFESSIAFHGCLPGSGSVSRPMYGYGWKRPDLHFWFFRSNYLRRFAPWLHLPWDMTREIAEISTQGPKRGFGRIGLDFWPVLKNAKGEPMGHLLARYPKSSWLQLDSVITCWVPPGPDGAMHTGKLQMLREGLQENEARILLENALVTPTLKAKLPPELAAQCDRVLQGRIRSLAVALERQGGAGFLRAYAYLDGYNPGDYNGQDPAIFHQWFMASGWQERSRQLLDTAAEVEKLIGPMPAGASSPTRAPGGA